MIDVYHKWLSIPPSEQPPNHYRLLGLGPFESDPDVIQAAADRQMAHVQTYKNGPLAEQSQKLLTEIAVAKLCLLKPDKKAAYDEQLRSQAAAAARSSGIRRATPLNEAAPLNVAAPPAIAGSSGGAASAPSQSGVLRGRGVEPSTALPAAELPLAEMLSQSTPMRRATAISAVRPGVKRTKRSQGPHGGKTAMYTVAASVAILLAFGLVMSLLSHDETGSDNGTGNTGKEAASSADPTRKAGAAASQHGEKGGPSEKHAGAGDQKTGSANADGGQKNGNHSSTTVNPGSGAGNTVDPSNTDSGAPRSGVRVDPADRSLPRGGGGDAPVEKISVPAVAALAEAEQRLGKASAHSAAEWLDQGRTMKPGPDAYAALHRSLERSVDDGDVAGATQATDEIEKRFIVIPFELRTQALSDLRPHIETPAGWEALADAALTLVDDAATRDPPLAMRSAEQALSAARKAGNVELVKKVTLRILRLRQSQQPSPPSS